LGAGVCQVLPNPFFSVREIRVFSPQQTLLFFFQIKLKLIFSLQLIFVYCFHIHFGYAFYINLAQNRGVEVVNNHFQKCSMKVAFRKRNLKKTIIYSDYLLKNICQEDPNSHFSSYKSNEIIFG
jgi:hypothetical protein